MESGESIEDALARELSEEAGIIELSRIEHYDTLLSMINITVDRNEYGLILVIYKVSISRNTVIKLGDDEEAVEWVLPESVGERITNKYPEEFRLKLASL